MTRPGSPVEVPMEGKQVRPKPPLLPRAFAWASLAVLFLSTGLIAWAQSDNRPIVADVVIKGNRLIPTEQILRYVHTKPGGEFSPATIQKDVERLSLSGLFQRPPIVTDRPTGDGRVLVVFEVIEYPNVVRDVMFKHANHISDKELESMVRIRKGTPLDPVRNKLACYEIQDYLRKKGRLFANVTLEEGYKPTDTRVIFNVTE